jgi:sugar phosphate isomerase/epimerase
MKKQNYELKSEKIKKKFKELKEKNPEQIKEDIKLSFSIWMFGSESLDQSFKRLNQAGYNYVELAGNHYLKEFGSDYQQVKELLEKYELKVSGSCGLYSAEVDLSSDSPYTRKNAVDYIKNEVEFLEKVGGSYLILVPSAVGASGAFDENAYLRSIETAKTAAQAVKDSPVRIAVEPIRSAEVNLINTVAKALDYLEKIDDSSIQHINGDIFHMLNEEEHLGEAILTADDKLVNLHLADSNRGAIGKGMTDIDLVISALYLIGYNQGNKFVTGEPLGVGGDPYSLMNQKGNQEKYDFLVKQTKDYFRAREKELKKQRG